MTPIFERGDLLFLAMPSAPLVVGDIPVFQIKGQPIPIVHRLLEIHIEYVTWITDSYLLILLHNKALLMERIIF